MILWLCAKMHYPQIRVKLWRCSSGFWDGSLQRMGIRQHFSHPHLQLLVEVNLSSAAIGSIEFANTEKRRVETISLILKKGTPTVVESQKLRGRMQFMDGQLFGRLGRLCMRAITDHSFIKKHVKLDRTTRESLERFLIFLEHAKPRQLMQTLGMLGSSTQTHATSRKTHHGHADWVESW